MSTNPKQQIPIALKEIIADHFKRETISVEKLSKIYGVGVPAIHSFKNTFPMREQYFKIFGPTEDLSKVNVWINEQLKNYILS